MNYPKELKYSETHEWLKFEGEDTALIGLTDFAQSELGGLVFVNLPEVGDEVEAADVFGDVESVKAVSDLVCPVTGTVAEINEELLDAPEKINETPYDAWLVKVSGITAQEDLMDSDAYQLFVEDN